jgi:hypothetical protein
MVCRARRYLAAAVAEGMVATTVTVPISTARLRLVWLLATCTPVVVALLIIHVGLLFLLRPVVVLASHAAIVLGVPLGQAIWLSRAGMRGARWFVRSAIGFVLGGAVGVGVLSMADSFGSEAIGTMLGALAFGVGIGAAQRAPVRERGASGGVWLAANSVGWLLGALAWRVAWDSADHSAVAALLDLLGAAALLGHNEISFLSAGVVASALLTGMALPQLFAGGQSRGV